MEIKEISIEGIKPYEKNPRVITELAISQVAQSIEKYGFRQPLVVDSEGVVIVGHTRLEAAKLLGLKVVPVHVAEDLSEDQLRAYRVADNKVAEYTDWESEILAEEIEALMEKDFELSDFGMTDDDLSFLVSTTFSPEMNPTSPEMGAGAPVTAKDVGAAEQKLGSIGTVQQDLVDLICPECGYEYHLDPKSLEI